MANPHSYRVRTPSSCVSAAWRALVGLSVLCLVTLLPARAAERAFEVKPVSEAMAKEYKLPPSFYTKCTAVQDLLIATSDKVSDYAHLEAAYQIDRIMCDLAPAVAQRIRDKKVLCLIVGCMELTSDLPQYPCSKTGKELDFYNWRNRGSLGNVNGRPTLLVAEEDVMEYEGGMQTESILVHEFGHVIDGAGFDKALRERVAAAFKRAKDKGLYNDGYAAQRFRRVKSPTPVSLLEALAKSFPSEPSPFLAACLDKGDILVNGKASHSKVAVTKDDKVLIVFGGPKQCYAGLNRAEYWAEGVQDWYDTNRTMDHDHSQLHTRDQLKAYDPELAKILAEVLGDREWRYVSPRLRAGKGHLAGYDLSKAPKAPQLEHIETAAQDYYDNYWKPFWKRLHVKHGLAKDEPATQTK